MTLQSGEGVSVLHSAGDCTGGSPQHFRRGRYFSWRANGDGRPQSLFVHAAQQFLAHDHIEPRLLIGIEHGAHFEDVRNGVSLGLAHGVVKAINRLGEAFTLGVVLGHGGGNLARGRAQFGVKRSFAQSVTGFDRLQPTVLFGRQIKFAMDRRIERVPMGFGTRESCPYKHTPKPRAEPDERGQGEHLPGFQHNLSAERGGGRIGLIERKRPSLDRCRRGDRRDADGGADHKDEGADASYCAVGASASPASRARINPGPDIALQPVQRCVNVHPAQSSELAIKVGQGSLRAITFFYTRAAARALTTASPLGRGRARMRRPRSQIHGIDSKQGAGAS